MKRVSVGLLACFLLTVLAMAHQAGEEETSVELGKGKVTIHYGTPTLGDRNLDDMIKPGLAWRMGMNNPTTIETTVDLEFGGRKLPTGKHSLFARSDENKNWTLLICSGMKTMLDPSTVVLETPLHFMRADESQDLLKIVLEKNAAGASLTVAWGTYQLHGTFKAA